MSYNVRSITAIGAVAGGDRPEMRVPEKSQASTGTPKGVAPRCIPSVQVCGRAVVCGVLRAQVLL